jgi:hypothetical protein
MPVYHTTAAPAGEEAGKLGKSVWDESHTITGELELTAMTPPSTPASGKLRLFAETLAGRQLLRLLDSNGELAAVQPHFACGQISMLLPATGTAPALMGIPHNATGTASHPALASTNLRTQMRRTNYVSGTTASAGCGTRSNQTMAWRGNAAGFGGFFYSARVALSAVPASVSNAFVGLRATTAVIAAGTEPSALTDIVGFGFDRADTSWQVMTNDASGAADKTALGANFPIDTSSVYDVALYAPPNGSAIYYWIKNLGTGNTASGTLSSNLPTAATFLSLHIYMSMNSGSTAVGIDVMRQYLETP